MPYYYTGRSGDSYLDATVHYESDCAEIDDPVRPIAETSVDDSDVTFCENCSPLESEPESDSGAGETCEVELSAGGICGREKPCPYHD